MTSGTETWCHTTPELEAYLRRLVAPSPNGEPHRPARFMLTRVSDGSTFEAEFRPESMQDFSVPNADFELLYQVTIWLNGDSGMPRELTVLPEKHRAYYLASSSRSEDYDD